MALEESVLLKLRMHQQQFSMLEAKLSDPSIIGNSNEFQRLSRERGAAQELVDSFVTYEQTVKELEENKALLADSDESIREMAKEEIPRLESLVLNQEQQLRILLLPKDPLDDRNVILELRAGAGGEEASLFVADLFRAYRMYAGTVGWRFEVLEASPSGQGGFKEVVANISGDKIYSKMKFESGVHRVQRVPDTEGSGRIHTSTITVAVLPEADEVDVKVNPNDIRIDVFRSGGSGGQSVNTTDSAVRIFHIPTGTTVVCQDEKSQIKNREKALKILRARLYERAVQEQHQQIADARKEQVGTGDRSERIRTYNFPQNRVTDHRIGLTLHNLPEVMNGDLEQLMGALVADHQATLLNSMFKKS